MDRRCNLSDAICRGKSRLLGPLRAAVELPQAEGATASARLTRGAARLSDMALPGWLSSCTKTQGTKDPSRAPTLGSELRDWALLRVESSA